MSEAMDKRIPLSEPEISGNEWKYVKECLDTGWVSYLGEYVNRFEASLAAYVGSAHAVAVTSGTAALHLALMLCGVRPGDEVIVPTLTFIAPVNTVTYVGAVPVFMDADPGTLCMHHEKTSRFLEEECEMRDDGHCYNRTSGRRVKAIMPVHIFGHPAEISTLLGLASQFNLQMIEDATESLGSSYAGKYTGTFGACGCFSFNGNKIMTTGGGGMLVTDNADLARRARHLSTQAKKDPFEYDHDEIGFNYRLTNVQAAIGCAQVERLPEFITRKRDKALLYRELLSGVSEAQFLWEKENVYANFWFYTLRVPAYMKKGLMEHLIAKGIQVRPIWKLIHTLPMYGYCPGYKIEDAIEAYDTCFNIPCSVGLKNDDVEYVAGLITQYMKEH